MRQLVIKKQVGPAFQQNGNSNQMSSTIANEIGRGVAQGLQGQGVTQLPQNERYSRQPLPDTFNYTVTSSTTTGSGTVTGYIFNEDVYHETPTTNGGAAGGVVSTYSDGFSGNWYNNAIKTYNHGDGVEIFGWTVQAYTVSTGAQLTSVYSTMNFTWNPYNGYGYSQAETKDFKQALRNTQYQNGIFTVRFNMMLNAAGQFSFVLPTNVQLIFTFMLKPFDN